MAKYNKAPFRIFKRGETWHTYFSVVANGRRIVVRESCGTTDENAAKEYCARRLREITESPAVIHEITLDAAATKWYLEYAQHLSNPDEYFSKIKQILKGFNRNLYLSQLSKIDISNFVAASQNAGRSPATINRHLVVLSSICTRAREKWDCKTPDFKILSFKLKVPTEHIKYFHSIDEIQKIINCAPEHIKPVIWTAIYTGLRRGRILSLTWSQIDFENNQIVFIGKNGKNQSVPMVRPLADLFKSLPRNGERVFNLSGTGIPALRYGWRVACKRAGIPYQNFHTLRHTIATWLLRDTHDLRLVKDVLGHQSMQTTLKYAHLVNDARYNAMNNLFDKPE